MAIAIFLISFAIGAAIVLRAYRMRAATLRRLRGFVAPPIVARHAVESAPENALYRFLPHRVARDLRLLDISLSGKAAVSGVALLAGTAIAANVLAGALAALVLCASVPLIAVAVLHVLAERRVRELGSFLPRFFDRVRQLLVIGNSLPTAFARAIDGSHPRLIAFFAPALRRIANGAGFADAIRQSSDDIALYEMHLFATAVSTNLRFGGSLTHALNNLVRFLQKRASVERELRASTSLIRTSAWVLALLPVLVGALIVTQNQEYARWFVADPLGRSLLVYCAASQIAGVLAMRAITASEF